MRLGALAQHLTQLGHAPQPSNDLAVLQGDGDGFLQGQVPVGIKLRVGERDWFSRMAGIRQRSRLDVGIFNIGGEVQIVGQIAVLVQIAWLDRVTAGEQQHAPHQPTESRSEAGRGHQ